MKKRKKQKNNNIKVYIMSGNKPSKVKKEGYYLFQVGASINKDVDISKYKDNQGDNISEKNRNYCELTGLYWIWKNDQSKIVGLNHYRRFFFKNMFSMKIDNVIDKEDINVILKTHDIILPTMGHTTYTVYNQYKKFHYIEDLELVGKIIEKDYPEYYDSFKKLLKHKYYYPFNMFICKKELIDEYCNWLFNILGKVEEKIQDELESRDKYNRRVYGFLSERLFNVWLMNKNLKIKELPVYNIENNKFKEKSIEFLKKILKIIRRA